MENKGLIKDEVLINKVLPFAGIFVESSNEMTNIMFHGLLEKKTNINEKKFSSIFSEVLWYNLCIMIEIVLRHLGTDNGDRFVKVFLIGVQERLVMDEKNEIRANQFKEDFLKVFFARQEEYLVGLAKLFSKECDTERDMLFNEFSNKIANILGIDKDVSLIMYIKDIIAEATSSFTRGTLEFLNKQF